MLDPELVREVLAVIREVARGELAPPGADAKPLTTIIVTHEIGFAREIANRVAFIDAGRIAEIGPAAQVIDAPREPRTQAFLSKLL
jgi:polar amino acid transport system ATP-binding protein